MKGQMFKPGTVVLFFFIAIVGYASYTLVSGDVKDIGASASDERTKVMDCSELDVTFVDVLETEEGVDIFFRSNVDLERVSIGSEDSNTTRTLEDIEANTMYNATVNISDYDNIYIEAGRCPDVYRWQ